MFQLLKYFLVRTGISLFALLIFGYCVLYLVHEVALPQVEFDDELIQWALLLICTFFGFLAYGVIGEQRFHNAFHSLKDAGPLDDQEEVTRQFENLLRFTESSYFLPNQARRFRGLVVRKYADYLYSIGREGPEALKIYLKAFLQNPKHSKFRAPLLSILSQGGDLTESEIDLLMVMLKAENFADDVIINHLASVFLRQKKFTGKTEPVFLCAVENESRDAQDILHFVVPILLANRRSDVTALRFYLHALPLHMPGEGPMREIVARNYCEEYLEAIDPVLHEKCGQAFHALDSGQRSAIQKSVEDNRLSGRVKKVKFVTRDDVKDISLWKTRLGIEKSIAGKAASGLLGCFRWFARAGRKLLFWMVDGLAAFGKTRLTVKLVSVAVVCLLVFAGLVGLERKGTQEKVIKAPVSLPQQEVALPPALPRPALNGKVHSIQIAAVTSAKQADRVVNTLKKNGVKEIFIVKSPRSSGGDWYKIRVGKFDAKEDALQLANRLMDDKTIKNYFVVSLPKTGNPESGNRPSPLKGG